MAAASVRARPQRASPTALTGQLGCRARAHALAAGLGSCGKVLSSQCFPVVSASSMGQHHLTALRARVRGSVPPAMIVV